MSYRIGYSTNAQKVIKKWKKSNPRAFKKLHDLHGVTTKEINQAVKNNPEKFPEGYVITLTANEKGELVKNFDRFNTLKHSTVLPHAFTEKGLYMLATIIKSKVDTFTKIDLIYVAK